ncbi:H+ Antiporter protein [Limihaloglobus sulfuriphilus]|uniref:H+ Antiporter protein n=1 Tax=Limihaloglobus sulfuriphilus TaxID=1851148 RepID=A0A1R7T606_9BACT|nr:MFS transporter [Limihaloglobus sulfuriphilus]AQQ72096.1 H+ Antiporter protein [Limihaloglobus sulfuriphilus]
MSAKVKRLTEVEKLMKLPWLVAASMTNSVFVILTFAGSVFILFLNELGFSKSQTGTIISLMPFCQVLGIFVGPLIARVGYRKMFLSFSLARTLIMSMILLVPFVAGKYGTQGAYYVFMGIFLSFAICRACGETGFVAWTQEIIPNSIRGKFSSVNSIISTLTMMATFAISGYVLRRFEHLGLSRFMILISAGLLMGYVSLVFYYLLPGGTAVHESERKNAGFTAILSSLKDRLYLKYLTGVSLGVLGSGALFSFLPLYMKEVAGIEAGTIVWIDLGGMTGSIMLSYLWGWACDRYGSRPVMLTSLALLAFVPMLWYFLPRGSASTPVLAFFMSFAGGASNIGWLVAMGQYLYNTIVPEEKKGAYMPVFYAVTGLLAGTGPLLAGLLLESTGDFSYSIWKLSFDSYSLLFGSAILILLAAAFVIKHLQSDGRLTTQQFVGIFFQGNPVSALGNIIRFHRGGDETFRADITERLGLAGGSISMDELIDALDDPSFHVRHEAINSLARLKSHPDIINALLGVAAGEQPDLALSAVRSLGKLGDRTAIIPLRELLLSEYELLQAAAARSLGRLGDVDSKSFMLQRMNEIDDNGLRLAYASALGALHANEAIDKMFNLLCELEDQPSRSEAAWAIAKIMGNENLYILMDRRLRKKPGTATARILLSLRKLHADTLNTDDVKAAYQSAVSAFANGKMRTGADRLCELFEKYPPQGLTEAAVYAAQRCLEQLRKPDEPRIEFLLLLLQALREKEKKTGKSPNATDETGGKLNHAEQQTPVEPQNPDKNQDKTDTSP